MVLFVSVTQQIHNQLTEEHKPVTCLTEVKIALAALSSPTVPVPDDASCFLKMYVCVCVCACVCVCVCVFLE